mmetsp:Transcript_6912/g.12383  ORF Transcript_6912/g.12383 Transcript_6912/m.12383 type:complete len:224 (+) Transcript_6912:386-1057(+)
MHWILSWMIYELIGILVVLSAEYVCRKRWITGQYIRKFIHVAASLAPFFLIYKIHCTKNLLIFVHVKTLISNSYLYKTKQFKSLSEKVDNPGIVTFAIGMLLIVVFGLEENLSSDQSLKALLSITVLSIGDASAAVFGTAFGRYKYQAPIGSGYKSVEGSFAMLISTILAIHLTSRLIGAEFMTWKLNVATSIAATLIEACSSFGLDNITIPLISFGVLYLFG